MAELGRVGQIMADAIGRDDGVPLPERLCLACVEALAVHSAAISLMGGSTTPTATFASDAMSASIDQLQFTLGDGPCLDAYGSGLPVLVCDMGGADGARWPMLAAGLAGAVPRLGAVVASPLQVNGTAFGVLSLYCLQPCGPAAVDRGAVQIAVDASTLALLAALAQVEHTPTWLDEPGTVGVEVEQAVGMIMAQLETSAEVVVVRLRAKAFAEEVPIVDLARAVVARRVRFGDDGRTGSA